MGFFNRVFHAADKYMQESKWTDLALLKFCLCAIGIIIGLNVAKEDKETAQVCAGIVFITAYIPLMAKFVPLLLEELKDKKDI